MKDVSYSRLQKKSAAIVLDDDDDLLNEEEPTGAAARQQPSVVDVADDVSGGGDMDMTEEEEEAVNEGLEDPEEKLASLIRLTSKSSDLDTDGVLLAVQAYIAKVTADSAKASQAEELQPAFQSSTTTYNERGGRYLVWNSVGMRIKRCVYT